MRHVLRVHGPRRTCTLVAVLLVVSIGGLGCREAKAPGSETAAAPRDVGVTGGMAMSSARTTAQAAAPPEEVFIAGERFLLEVANTDALRTKGLMYRRTIDPHGGMLFVFPFSFVQNFWMGNCLTDIDILYLDPMGRVTAAHEMKAEEPQRADETYADYHARMPRYPSRLPAQFAIELAPGSIRRLEVAIGDTIRVDVKRLVGLAR
jgi:uncharacterized membrane protein (UPF0127 family)